MMEIVCVAEVIYTFWIYILLGSRRNITALNHDLNRVTMCDDETGVSGKLKQQQKVSLNVSIFT